MARSALTLAALATAAVSGLDVTAASRLGSGTIGSFEQAVLDTREGRRVVIRVPRTQAAEAQASSNLAALSALSAGVRGRLPFEVPSFLGQVPVGGTRAIVYDYLPGSAVTLDGLNPNDGLAASIGRAIAAIHSLPTSFVSDASLPVARPADARSAVAAVMEEASATGLVPAGLLARWEGATEDAALWQFAPAVVNGAVSASSLLHDDEGTVTGIIDWHALSVGDPARDLAWVLGAPVAGAADSVFDAYNQARDSSDRQVKKRATLYAELEIAKWLLHGTRQKSTEIVDDAVGMLHNLLDVVRSDSSRSIDTNTSPVMTVSEVEEMLDRKERRS